MSHASWAPVSRVADLSGAGPHAARARGRDLVLVQTTQGWRAFEGHCPHEGTPLQEARVEAGALVCPSHDWRFSLPSGERDVGPECLARFETRIREGMLEVELVDEAVDEVVEAPVLRSPKQLPGPRAWPLVGNTLQLDLERLHLTLEGWVDEYGPVYRFDLGPTPFVAVAEPELIRRALHARPGTFRRLNTFEAVAREMGVNGVFTAEGADWRPQRRLVVNAMNPKHLKGFFPTLVSVSEQLLARWGRAADEGRVIDMQIEMMRFTVDVTTRLAFSATTNTLADEPSLLIDSLKPFFPMIGYRMSALFPHWRYIKLPSDRALDAGLADVRAWLSQVISELRVELDADPARAAAPRDFLEAMIAERDEDGDAFSEELLFANAMTMLLAGEDTTANTLSWMVHLLLDHPESLAPLSAQIDDTMGDQRLPLDRAMCDALTLSDGVANEALRLKPTAPFLLLQATEDTVLGDLALEAGTGVAAMIRKPAMDPAWVDRPAEFLPERWSDRRLSARLARTGVFSPFGGGPRVCPGRSLALLEIRVALATLYRNFVVERANRSEDVQEFFGFTVQPKNLLVRLRRR
jgi:cytochrome P450/nitrite reductase/ring-hydroxylating ferredoxin subunit